MPTKRKIIKDPEKVPESKGIEGKANGSALATGKTAKRLTSLQEAIDFFEIDTDVWEVERWICGSWEQGAKFEEDIIVTPLYQVKVWLKPRVGVKGLKEIIDDLKSIKLPKPVIGRLKKKPVNGSLLTLNIPDLHLGKVCWDEDTGNHYDVATACKVFKDATLDLLQQATDSHKIEKVLIPIGNDFFNTNGATAETKKGTPQDEDPRWFRTYRKGVDIVTELICYIRRETGATVDVICVPGNHDEDKILHMTFLLSQTFKDVKGVNVDASKRSRKYFRHGDLLIGMTHGDKRDRLKLPQLMTGEMPVDSSECRWKEFYMGHTHHLKTKDCYVEKDNEGVMERTFPSLSGTDVYHYNEGYTLSQRMAQAIVYKNDGRPSSVYYYYA